MMIFAIDLGKFKSVGCLYDTDSKSATYSKFDNRPDVVHDLLVEHKPDRLVIEIGTTAGWVQDIGEALEIPTQVANTNHAAWRFSVNPNKSDRNNALRLAKMSALDELPTVNLPGKKIREWRSLIGYRTRLVRERTSIKNAIRSCLDQRGERMPPAVKGWGRENLERLAAMAKPMDQCPLDQLWRGILHEELGRLEQVQERLKSIEAKLDEVARADPRVKQLQSIPGVGPRLAEIVVATIHDPHRFPSRREVASYAGLTPARYQSGNTDRQGRITCRGNPILRSLLVEVAWLTRRHNPHFAAIFDEVTHGDKKRKKIAVVAVARRLLVTCWAMLRDRTQWKDPSLATAGPPPGPAEREISQREVLAA